MLIHVVVVPFGASRAQSLDRGLSAGASWFSVWEKKIRHSPYEYT